MNYPADNACPFHRMLMPARFCAPDFAPLGCDIKVGAHLESGRDWIAVHGLPEPLFMLEVQRHKNKGSKFLWSLDDDFLSIPESNPAKPGEIGLVVYEIAKAIADLILVSTRAIADTLSDVAHKVVVAPNLIDLSAFPKWDRNATTAEVELPVKIGWAGGPTHKDDTEQLVDPLSRVLDRFGPDQVQLVWFGPLPPPTLIRDYLRKGLLYQPMEMFANYQLMINAIDPDIWLAPLDPVPFNASKSNLRIMEAWGLQAVPVATPHGEYNCIRSGEDGRYAATADEWYSALSRLVQDHEYRMNLADHGRYRVGQEYDWNNFACRKPWLDVFARIFDVDPPTEPGTGQSKIVKPMVTQGKLAHL